MTRKTILLIGSANLLGILVGLSLGLAINESSYKHDPALMLILRDKCNENDRHATTLYCDRYAEEFSRLPLGTKP